jgi:hypothetical protein
MIEEYRTGWKKFEWRIKCQNYINKLNSVLCGMMCTRVSMYLLNGRSGNHVH